MRKFIVFLSLLIPMCFVMPVCGADGQITVTGTVMCQDDACVGATVHEYAGDKGTSNGVAADVDG
ncbi:MAG: hypothetical protein R8M37_04560, partial [Alphaproteobacteria bacterium]|nr:hypothetical protein [Alphaproteobacteria bacterium]